MKSAKTHTVRATYRVPLMMMIGLSALALAAVPTSGANAQVPQQVASVLAPQSELIGSPPDGRPEYAPSGVPLPGQDALSLEQAGSTDPSSVTPDQVVSIDTPCEGATHHPHESQDHISVHASTSCPFITNMLVSTNLYRERWYGQQHLAHHAQEKNKAYVESKPRWYCAGTGRYDYTGESWHRAYVDGEPATARTSETKRISC